MKVLIILILLIKILLFNNVSAETLVFFTPSPECENHIIKLIDNSRKNIDIAVYAITNKNIVNALKRAHNRNIKIKILTDRTQASNQYSKVIDLYKYGINIKVNSKNKIEHNKFAIFDYSVLFVGSYNWTNSASYDNSENCMFIDDKRVVNKYGKRFEYLWMINTNKESRSWFKENSDEKSRKQYYKKYYNRFTDY